VPGVRTALAIIGLSVLLSDLGLPALTIENILETDWRFQRASEAPL